MFDTLVLIETICVSFVETRNSIDDESNSDGIDISFTVLSTDNILVVNDVESNSEGIEISLTVFSNVDTLLTKEVSLYIEPLRLVNLWSIEESPDIRDSSSLDSLLSIEGSANSN